MVIEGSVIELVCKACGGTSAVDEDHRLSAFILKNPPPPPPPEQYEHFSVKWSNSIHSSEKVFKKFAKLDLDDDDMVWHTDTSKAAVEQRRKDMLDNTSELAVRLVESGTLFAFCICGANTYCSET